MFEKKDRKWNFLNFCIAGWFIEGGRQNGRIEILKSIFLSFGLFNLENLCKSKWTHQTKAKCDTFVKHSVSAIAFQH